MRSTMISKVDFSVIKYCRRAGTTPDMVDGSVITDDNNVIEIFEDDNYLIMEM